MIVNCEVYEMFAYRNVGEVVVYEWFYVCDVNFVNSDVFNVFAYWNVGVWCVRCLYAT